MVAVVEEHRHPVGQVLAAFPAGDRCPGSHVVQGDNAGVGPVFPDAAFQVEVFQMFLQHHKGDAVQVDVFGDAAGRPVEKGLAVDLDEGFGADEAVFKKAAAPPGHGHDKV